MSTRWNCLPGDMVELDHNYNVFVEPGDMTTRFAVTHAKQLAVLIVEGGFWSFFLLLGKSPAVGWLSNNGIRRKIGA